MAIGKTLTNIVLAGVLALSEAGCAKDPSSLSSFSSERNPEYTFRGKIGEEHVRFYEAYKGRHNRLFVYNKEDGTAFLFVDNNNDFQIDQITLYSNPKIQYHGESSSIFINHVKIPPQYFLNSCINSHVTLVFRESQKKFEAYLDRIREIRMTVEETVE